MLAAKHAEQQRDLIPPASDLPGCSDLGQLELQQKWQQHLKVEECPQCEAELLGCFQLEKKLCWGTFEQPAVYAVHAGMVLEKRA